IQRERDVFYPIQHCPQSSTVTSCADVHPDKEECVSVCVLRRDSDSLNVSAELDDSVFKSSDLPQAGHIGQRCLWSPSHLDNYCCMGAHSPSEAWSVGSPDDAVSQSSRLSWKSGNRGQR
ncbi:A-kinase anchor protein 13-like isoform X1, partial [Lates japonicus]